MFNIPTQITQGDLIKWSETFPDYNPVSDTLSCFIRGKSALDLTGVANEDKWDFTIDIDQSILLTAGRYQAQFVVFTDASSRHTLGNVQLEVCPSFENLTELETRTDDEIELEQINKALSKGITEYRIGDRMVQYHSLKDLSDRQKYLRVRIAITKGKMKPGGRNVEIRFCD